ETKIRTRSSSVRIASSAYLARYRSCKRNLLTSDWAIVRLFKMLTSISRLGVVEATDTFGACCTRPDTTARFPSSPLLVPCFGAMRVAVASYIFDDRSDTAADRHKPAASTLITSHR